MGAVAKMNERKSKAATTSLGDKLTAAAKAAAVSALTQPVAVTPATAAKPKEPKPFTVKAEFQGPTERLTVQVNERKAANFDETPMFVVKVVHAKPGVPKVRGMITETSSKDEALQKFGEIKNACVQKKWKMVAAPSRAKSAFDEIPDAK